MVPDGWLTLHRNYGSTTPEYPKYDRLNEVQLNRLKEIVALNQFYETTATGDPAVDEVLGYYKVRRDRN